MDKLKPCPFCGVVPAINWEAWKEISPKSGAYVLEANHYDWCFLRKMNGTNYKGRMTAFNEDALVEAWNRRANDGC